MPDESTLARLEREVRVLRRCAAVTLLGFLLLGAAAFQSAQRQRFGVIDVERINVVEPDGRLALVVANQQRMPGVWMEGREHGTREGMNGIIFFNSEGDESGGLIHHSARAAEGVTAGAQLSMDRFESDQVVALNYTERPGYYSAGLRVSDFPMGSTREWFAAQDSIGRLPESARAAARQALRRRFMAEGKWEVNRVFVGQEQGRAGMRIHDQAGRTRIRIAVDSLDVPRLEFLDAEEKVVYTLPETR
ncbi:MAG TPA: hypothetical protein VK358_08215 [Longimicrobium sp.]|nr:hypothetical protein [Longimicrobium sp.]